MMKNVLLFTSYVNIIILICELFNSVYCQVSPIGNGYNPNLSKHITDPRAIGHDFPVYELPVGRGDGQLDPFNKFQPGMPAYKMGENPWEQPSGIAVIPYEPHCCRSAIRPTGYEKLPPGNPNDAKSGYTPDGHGASPDSATFFINVREKPKPMKWKTKNNLF